MQPECIYKLTYDAVILAGGRGSRLGGLDKAALPLAGEPLITSALQACAQARQTVVVGSTTAPLPSGVIATRENPPGSGPLAGLRQGLEALEAPAPWVLVLGCDLPGAATAVPRLVNALEPPADPYGKNLDDGDQSGDEGPHPGLAPPADGAVLVDPHGREQWVLGIYRRTALLERMPQASRSLRSLLGHLDLVRVATTGPEWQDVDTWSDHAEWTSRLATPSD